ncbi:MAG TPA: hypothetical protein VF940_23955 [Streptosporangiaceae bacterium]
MAAVVVIQLAVAPLTLALAALFVCISRYGRWRPLWLIMPVMAGLAWVAAAGAGGAISSYLATGSRLIGFLAHPGSVPPHLFRPGAALTDWQHRLPGQLPLALIIAAAEACAVGWSAGAAGCRPGLVIAARRAYLRAAHRRGEMATPGGSCVGTVMGTGRRAEISWREAQGGVLVTGRDAAGVTGTALELATAAIQHRKTVIIVDLTSGAASGARGTGGDGHAVAEAVKAACDGVQAPLAMFAAERGHYEPFSGASPDRAASLLTAMIDWSGVGQEQWLLSADRLGAALELLTSRWPATAGQRSSILDELAAQLDSAAPPATRAVAAQLAGLRSAAIGAGLCQPGPGDDEPIILGRAVAEREVVLFALDRLTHGRWAVMVAQLVIADLTGILADRARLGARADCLLWINGFEETARGQLEAQLALGPRAGVATLLSTAAGAAAGWLAGQVNVVAVRGQPPAGSAARAASSAGLAGVAGEISLSLEDGQGWPAALVGEQRPDGLSLAVRNPRPRLVTGCRAAR